MYPAGDSTEPLEMVQAIARLLRERRLESIGRLAAGIAHEMNNLLTPILGYTELLLGSLPADHPAHVQVAEVRKAAERSRDLVRRLMAFCGCQVLVPVTVSLHDLASGMEARIRRCVRPGVSFGFACDDGGVTLRVDRLQIENAVMNLVTNSQEAMPQGGALFIEARPARMDEREVLDRMGCDMSFPAVIRVSDTGAGIVRTVQQHLFEPFSTTKTTMGAGLGLATVWGIVRQHGGIVLVNSSVGRGTSVTIALPCLQVVAPSLGQAPVVHALDSAAVANLQG
jgi:two-component system, cell cycle sensor histidine kinase and response regulator CckA